MVLIVLKNGFRYQGRIVEETETEIILIDVRVGKLTITKSEIAVRGGGL